MSDSHDSSGADAGAEAHEGPIKTPKQLVVTVIAAFVVPIVVIIMLATFVSVGQREGEGSDSMAPEAVARRLQPIGSVDVRDASAPTVLRTGEQVFQGVCTACHSTGAAGAPKLGDAGAWAPRIRTGYETLLNSALHGKGAMPPQGGGDLADVEVGRAVVYMANQAGAKFSEPQPPVAAASAASGAEGGGATAAAAPASAASSGG